VKLIDRITSERSHPEQRSSAERVAQSFSVAGKSTLAPIVFRRLMGGAIERFIY